MNGCVRIPTLFIAAGAFAAFSLLSLNAVAQSASAALSPGEYVSDGGSGRLSLKSGKNGALMFAIESAGSNGHTCSLDGEVRNGKARLAGEDEKTPCIVTFKLTPAGIDVKGSSFDACGSQYCGMRATFEAVYLLPPAACASAAVTATRKSFKQLYDSKQFAAARAKLEPVLNDCLRTLDWLSVARVRNDVAVTLHKLGDMAACRAVLAPLAEDANMPDAGVRENYPPSDADVYLPVVRATRTNLKLCK